MPVAFSRRRHCRRHGVFISPYAFTRPPAANAQQAPLAFARFRHVFLRLRSALRRFLSPLIRREAGRLSTGFSFFRFLIAPRRFVYKIFFCFLRCFIQQRHTPLCARCSSMMPLFPLPPFFPPACLRDCFFAAAATALAAMLSPPRRHFAASASRHATRCCRQRYASAALLRVPRAR